MEFDYCCRKKIVLKFKCIVERTQPWVNWQDNCFSAKISVPDQNVPIRSDVVQCTCWFCGALCGQEHWGLKPKVFVCGILAKMSCTLSFHIVCITGTWEHTGDALGIIPAVAIRTASCLQQIPYSPCISRVQVQAQVSLK